MQTENEASANQNEDSVLEDKDYFKFNLRGVVVHSGTADSGHYYSFIQESKTNATEKWLEFNDSYVWEYEKSRLS